MKRTTITLTDELAAAVQREARRRHVSASHVVREALTKQFGVPEDGIRKLPFVALGRSGYRTTARDFEEILDAEWSRDLDR